VVGFDRLGDSPMKQAAPRAEKLGIRHGTDALVHEVESGRFGTLGEPFIRAAVGSARPATVGRASGH